MIKPYSTGWPIKYNKEYYVLKSNLGNLVLDIQHIGSTAIPGMRAKPVIDIMVAVKSLDDAGPLHPILEKLGYEYKPDMSSTERMFFQKGSPVEFHLSIAQPDHTSYWERQILFRDFLITHPDYIKEYERVKEEAIRKISKMDSKDISLTKVYSSFKTPFIEKILTLAKKENRISARKEITDGLAEYFIHWAKDVIKDEAAKVSKELHGDEGVVYKIESKQGNYFLKLKADSAFSKERERIAWFQNKLPVPQVIDFTEKEDIGAVLLTAIEGKNLAALSKEWPAEKVIDKLAEVLYRFHDVSTEGWPFDPQDSSKVLVHGDACLPNFIFQDDLFSGYIDLADARLADRDVDLSAAIWSLQYNLGPGYGLPFLEKYGYKDATEELVEKLRLQYEDYQEAHGFL